MTSQEQLQKTLTLLQLERQADLEQYRQKVLLRSISDRVKEGVTWYPVKLIKDYIGTGERIIIEVEKTNAFDQPHAFQSGKVVSVFTNAHGTPQKQHVQGVINYVREALMVITLNGDDIPDWIEDGMLGVDVMFDEMTYKEMEFALKQVMKAEDNRVAELRELLLSESKSNPVKKDDEQPNIIQNSLLNESQRKAISKILQATDVGFVHGPPGTGKTTTLVEAIRLTIKEQKQVLVCAPSNAAIDLLVEKLSELGIQTLRIGHPARVTEQTLSKTMDARIAAHPHFQELKAMRRKMEQLRTQAQKHKRNYGYHEKQERRLLFEEAKALKADADVLEFYIVNDLLNHSEAICSTLVGSSHPVLKGRKFKTVFIDEAAQALEPASWIPLLKSQRVIFAGDHQQLPPTIKSFEAAQQGLAKTLFEKSINKFPEFVSMLRVQYRMNDAIMRFSSDYFYQGKLLAHPTVAHQLLKPEQPAIEFIDTAGAGYQEAQDKETLSRFNKEEGNTLIRLLEKLVEEIGINKWLEEKITLGIITPYSAQVDFLNSLAESSSILTELGKLISVNTVDAFQGQERDVIAISFVRSNEKGEVGFLADIRRTNVAMTRARKKLMMIGDSATLGAHPFYAQLLDYVQQNNYYQSVFELSLD